MLDDVRQTLRFLAREPLLAVAMSVTLALGIGITAANLLRSGRRDHPAACLQES
jgi:hypothetical protein